MPVLASSAYNTAGTVLNRIRVILNDSEVAGGDVLTDSAPFTFELLNGAFERVQMELAKVGVEVCTKETWIIGLPVMAINDPEGRLIIDDTGTYITYPNGTGNVNPTVAGPFLPDDLVVPLKCWERQNGTTGNAVPMNQPNSGLNSVSQGQYLAEWEWENDGLRFRGATQSQDLKLKYEKHLPRLAAANDPVPIRGVTNAAAYFGATLFCASRGGSVTEEHKTSAMEEIFLLQTLSARRRQRKQVRRRAYSGRSS